MNDQHHLERINALTRNARTTWFTLLAALVFVSITLMGVEHIDFYGVDRATALPLVGVEVPTRLFFVAAPILIAAIYGYFHLYVIRLWDALCDAPANFETITLGEAVSPWLVSDALIYVRAVFTGDDCAIRRPLDFGAMLLNFLLIWGFGIGVLVWLWWVSATARDSGMTAWAAAGLFASLIAGFASLSALFLRLRRTSHHRSFLNNSPIMSLLVLLGAAIAGLTIDRTQRSPDWLAQINLDGETLALRPLGWLTYADAKKDFQSEWCRRETLVYGIEDCENTHDPQTGFEEEFSRRRSAARREIPRPSWSAVAPGPTHMDFRFANMNNIFLVGANLRQSHFDGADLRRAQLEGADLFGTTMTNTNLTKVQLEEADLRRANLSGADFSEAMMYGANLRMVKTMQGAIFRDAQMQRVNLRGAPLEGVDLTGAQMQGAMLDYLRITGIGTLLRGTDLRGATNHGGMLRNVDLSEVIFDGETDFRNVFLDGSVTLPDGFAEQMGNPCQWVQDEVLSDGEFLGRWRGWIENEPETGLTRIPGDDEFKRLGWKLVGQDSEHPEQSGEDIQVLPIPPPETCTWQTGPMP